MQQAKPPNVQIENVTGVVLDALSIGDIAEMPRGRPGVVRMTRRLDTSIWSICSVGKEIVANTLFFFASVFALYYLHLLWPLPL